MGKWAIRWLAGAALLLAGSAAAQDSGGLTYTPDGKLKFPADYREGIFLSSDFDLSYNVSLPAGSHVFGNVFVNRAAYAAFRRTRAWPDKTTLVLEMRQAGGDNPLNKRGHYQAGAPVKIEVHVKDAAKGGWGFYAFSEVHAPATRIAATANCYSCHAQHGATDTTFTQFYPTLADGAPR